MKNKKILLTTFVIFIIALFSILVSSKDVYAGTTEIDYTQLINALQETRLGIYPINYYLGIHPQSKVEPTLYLIKNFSIYSLLTIKKYI